LNNIFKGIDWFTVQNASSLTNMDHYSPHVSPVYTLLQNYTLYNHKSYYVLDIQSQDNYIVNE